VEVCKMIFEYLIQHVNIYSVLLLNVNQSFNLQNVLAQCLVNFALYRHC